MSISYVEHCRRMLSVSLQRARIFRAAGDSTKRRAAVSAALYFRRFARG